MKEPSESRITSTFVAMAWSVLSRGGRAAGRLLVFWVVARMFSLAETGRFSYYFSLGTLLALLSDMGVSVFVSRELPRRLRELLPAQRFFVTLRLVSYLGVVTLCAAALLAFGSAGRVGDLGTLVFALSISVCEFVGALHRARSRFDWEIVEIGAPLLLVVGFSIVFARTLFPGSPEGLQATMGAASFCYVVARFVVLAGRLPGSFPAGSLPTLSSLGLTPAPFLWLWISSLIGWALIDANVLLLRFLSSESEIALFASALRPLGFLTLPPIAMSFLFVPALAHELGFSEERFRAKVDEFNLLTLVYLPVGLVVLDMLGGGFLALFGEAYRQGAPILLVLSFGYSIYYGFWSHIPLLVKQKDRTVTLVGFLTLLVNVVCVAVLAPRYGALGAAISLLVAFTVAKVLVFAFYRRFALPLGGRRYFGTLALVWAWAILAYSLPDPAALVVKVLALVLGAVWILNYLLRARIFRP